MIPKKILEWNSLLLCIFLYLSHHSFEKLLKILHPISEFRSLQQKRWVGTCFFGSWVVLGSGPPKWPKTGVFQGEIIEFLGNSRILGFLMLDNWNQIFHREVPQKSAESMGISNYLASWWLNQPLWKICSSKWVHLPQFSGWKFQKYLKPSSS